MLNNGTYIRRLIRKILGSTMGEDALDVERPKILELLANGADTRWTPGTLWTQFIQGLSSVVWGDIGGTQSDVSLSGFTDDLGLLKDVSLTSPVVRHQLFFNGTNWVNRPGTDYKTVWNGGATTIAKGTFVSITGSAGAVPVATISDKDTNEVVAGLAVEDIAASTTGLIQAQGTIQEAFINTFGMSAGNLIYLGNDGGFTDSPPATGNILILGAIGVVAPSSGSLILDCPGYFDTNVWNVSGDDIYYNDGDVGFGTDNIQQRVHVATSADTDRLFIDRKSSDTGKIAGLGFRISSVAGNFSFAELLAIRKASGGAEFVLKTFDGSTKHDTTFTEDGDLDVSRDVLVDRTLETASIDLNRGSVDVTTNGTHTLDANDVSVVRTTADSGTVELKFSNADRKLIVVRKGGTSQVDLTNADDSAPSANIDSGMYMLFEEDISWVDM